MQGGGGAAHDCPVADSLPQRFVGSMKTTFFDDFLAFAIPIAHFIG